MPPYNLAPPFRARLFSMRILNTQAIGLSGEHQAFAGTLSLQPATLLALWGDIGAGVARAGVKKLLLFNAHGGNVSSMDIVARQLRQQHGLLVVHCSWFNLPLPQEVHAAFSAHEHRFGVHAGEVETSMLLHLAPEQVQMAQGLAQLLQEMHQLPLDTVGPAY